MKMKQCKREQEQGRDQSKQKERGVFFWWAGLEGKTCQFKSVGQRCLLFESMSFKKQASQVALVIKNPAASTGRHKRPGFSPWLGKIPWRREWLPTPVSLPGESMDRGAWWGTVHGVAKSRTRLSNFTSHIGYYINMKSATSDKQMK